MRDYKRDMKEYDRARNARAALIELAVVLCVFGVVLACIYWR